MPMASGWYNDFDMEMWQTCVYWVAKGPDTFAKLYISHAGAVVNKEEESNLFHCQDLYSYCHQKI